MEPIIDFYKGNIQLYQAALKRLQSRSTLVVILRIICFFSIIYTVYHWIVNKSSIWMFATFLMIALFIVFIRISWRLGDRKSLFQKLVLINNNELNVINGRPNHFPDGNEYLSNNDYSFDLDIFGSGSLFHLLNRTTTWHGKRELQQCLQQPILSKPAIEERQQAVQTLTAQKELRQLLVAHGMLNEAKEANLNDITDWLQRPAVLTGKPWLKWVGWVVSLYSTGALIYFLDTFNYRPLLPVCLVCVLINTIFYKYITKEFTLLGKKQAIIEQYASILDLFSKVEAGNSTQLQKEKAIATEASLSVKKLARLAALFDQKMNLAVNFIANLLYLYDIQCVLALERWKLKHKGQFDTWIHCTGTIETLNSLATYAFNNPAYRYPVVETDGLRISATQLVHPLIAAEKRVGNDFSFGKQEHLVLVTGSNMSGKTTFLRTLGINLILAQCGSPVCAQSFSFTPMVVRSSIRINDSLLEQTSYFMAELKRLQQIIHYLQTPDAKPVLILIDEILRGTNSDDKTNGSELFIRKILQFNCLTLFATHDLALSVLEQELPGKVSNYCFESTIKDGELLFDYRLGKGVAKNKNASFLMKRMEII